MKHRVVTIGRPKIAKSCGKTNYGERELRVVDGNVLRNKRQRSPQKKIYGIDKLEHEVSHKKAKTALHLIAPVHHKVFVKKRY